MTFSTLSEIVNKVLKCRTLCHFDRGRPLGSRNERSGEILSFSHEKDSSRAPFGQARNDTSRDFWPFFYKLSD